MSEPLNIPAIGEAPNATTPILANSGSAATPSFSVAKLFNDPNFVNLLAGIGAKLDPQGVGGALGTSTIAFNQAKAAQAAGAKTIANNARLMRSYEKVATRLGGMTPPGVEGATSLRVNKDGSYTATGNIGDDASQQDQLDDMLAPYGGGANAQQLPQNNITQSPAAPAAMPTQQPDISDEVADLVNPTIGATGSSSKVNASTPSAPLAQNASNPNVTLIAQKNTPQVTPQNTATRSSGASPQGAFSVDIAERKRVIDSAIDELAPSAGVRPSVIKGLISVENSAYEATRNNKQFGASGGQGLLQIIPSTWARYAPKDSNPHDPTLNLLVGIAHYKELLDYYGGDEMRAAAAYHSGTRNIPRDGAIPERVQQRAPDGRVFTQFPLRYAQRVVGVAETLPQYPQAIVRDATTAEAIPANATSTMPEQQELLAQRVTTAAQAQALPITRISATPAIAREVSDLVESRYASANITADDLRGLNPEQVDNVVKNALISQKLSNEIAELTGRSIRETKKELAQSANTIATLKLHAAREIAASNLTQEQQARAIDALVFCKKCKHFLSRHTSGDRFCVVNRPVLMYFRAP